MFCARFVGESINPTFRTMKEKTKTRAKSAAPTNEGQSQARKSNQSRCKKGFPFKGFGEKRKASSAANTTAKAVCKPGASTKNQSGIEDIVRLR